MAVSDTDTAPDELEFELVEAPIHGELIKTEGSTHTSMTNGGMICILQMFHWILTTGEFIIWIIKQSQNMQMISSILVCLCLHLPTPLHFFITTFPNLQMNQKACVNIVIEINN